MSDANSLGNAFQGNVTPQIDPPQVGVGPDTDKVGAEVLAPKKKNVADKKMAVTYQGDIHSRLDDLTNIGSSHTQIGPP